jgi:uncharacterized membrane protein
MGGLLHPARADDAGGAQNAVRAACWADAVRLCYAETAGALASGGQDPLAKCFSDNRDNLSDVCRAAIQDYLRTRLPAR